MTFGRDCVIGRPVQRAHRVVVHTEVVDMPLGLFRSAGSTLGGLG
ncbi:hypothetical protein OHB12_17195 [Nocardia sp. NBC_01730]|nr:hypothetical protein OHB12_17195 [Nocardia sp. NBC_01730]